MTFAQKYYAPRLVALGKSCALPLKPYKLPAISLLRSFASDPPSIGPERTERSLRRQLIALLVEHLVYLQSFDRVVVHYDGGQKMVARILWDAFESVVSDIALTWAHPKYDYMNSPRYRTVIEIPANDRKTSSIGFHRFHCSPQTPDRCRTRRTA